MHDGSATAIPNDTCPSGYKYLWSTNPPQTTQTASNLVSGIYYVTVSCDTNYVISTVSIGAGLHCILCSIDSIQDESNCQCNGSLKVDATGGELPYNYLWSSGQTTAKITNLCAGTYFVTVTSACGCTSMDTAIVKNITSVNDNNIENNIICFPNPTKGELSIDLGKLNQSEYTIEVSDLSGQLVYSEKIFNSANKSKTIDIKGLLKGVYYLKLYNKQTNFIRKIIKE